MAGNVLVRGGTIIDGSGHPAEPGDVRIRDGVITEVGGRLVPDGEAEIDASGAYVTPGFIDGHTHFDPSLFWDPDCDPMPQHGVTTVLMGNCSLSLAPVRPDHRKQVGETFGTIEEFPDVAFDDHVPWTWETYAEYVTSVAAGSYGVNVAGLVGLSMVRLFVVGEEAWDRPSTADERDRIVAVVDAALRGGAAGLSTSFSDVGRDGRLVPSAAADDDELRAVIDVLGRHRGHFEIIPRGVTTDRQDAMDTLERCARWCAAADVTLTWNAFLDLRNDPTISDDFLAFARRLQGEGMRALPTISPRPVDFTANWNGGLGFRYIPAWHTFVQADRPTKLAMLADPAWRRQAAEQWDDTTASVFPHHALEGVTVLDAARPDLERFVGSTFDVYARYHGGHPSDALADWVASNDLAPGMAYVVGNHDPARIGRLVADPATLVSASDAGAHVQAHCTAGDTTLLLARYVRDRGDMELEAAVTEMTARQADVYGFTDRGRIEVGKAGDLTVFALDELHWDEPVACHDFPGGSLRYRRPPGGYRSTVVAGVPTQSHGVATASRPGRWLPGKQPARTRVA